MGGKEDKGRNEIQVRKEILREKEVELENSKIPKFKNCTNITKMDLAITS